MAEISVLMGVFNGERFLREAILSLLAQREVDLEILVMDDGSTDGSAMLLAEIAAANPRVRVFRQENEGLASALNALIKRSEAPFLARMDADDISLPWRFADQLKYMTDHPEVAMAGTWTAFLGPDGRVRGCQCYPDDSKWLTGQLFAGRNVFVHSSMILRRSALEELDGPYRFRIVQDYDLWLRIAERHAVGMVERVGLVSRWHEERISGRKFDERRRLHHSIVERSRERRSEIPEAVTPAVMEAEARAGATSNELSVVDSVWYDAMTALYARDFKAAASSFAEVGGREGALAAKARRWRTVVSLPGASWWLPRLFRPLRFMKTAEEAMSAADRQEMTAIVTSGQGAAR